MMGLTVGCWTASNSGLGAMINDFGAEQVAGQWLMCHGSDWGSVGLCILEYWIVMIPVAV